MANLYRKRKYAGRRALKFGHRSPGPLERERRARSIFHYAPELLSYRYGEEKIPDVTAIR